MTWETFPLTSGVKHQNFEITCWNIFNRVKNLVFQRQHLLRRIKTFLERNTGTSSPKKDSEGKGIRDDFKQTEEKEIFLKKKKENPQGKEF